MIIQNVCLSINKLCNDTLHFVFLFCIYYSQVVFHQIQFRHTFELNYGYIKVNFCLYSIPNSRTDITKASCVNIGTSFINMEKMILLCKIIVYLIIDSVNSFITYGKRPFTSLYIIKLNRCCMGLYRGSILRSVKRIWEDTSYQKKLLF